MKIFFYPFMDLIKVFWELGLQFKLLKNNSGITGVFQPSNPFLYNIYGSIQYN